MDVNYTIERISEIKKEYSKYFSKISGVIIYFKYKDVFATKCVWNIRSRKIKYFKWSKYFK